MNFNGTNVPDEVLRHWLLCELLRIKAIRTRPITSKKGGLGIQFKLPSGHKLWDPIGELMYRLVCNATQLENLAALSRTDLLLAKALERAYRKHENVRLPIVTLQRVRGQLVVKGAPRQGKRVLLVARVERKREQGSHVAHLRNQGMQLDRVAYLVGKRGARSVMRPRRYNTIALFSPMSFGRPPERDD